MLWATAGALAARFEPDHPTQPGVLRCPVDRKKSHRHQKPVAVFEWLIEILHDRPGVVLDLFGGSLNALLAAERRVLVFHRPGQTGQGSGASVPACDA